MGKLTLRVTRPDDLLVIRFELDNFALAPHAPPGPRRLVRVDPGADATVVIHLPPQHIAEACFSVNPDGSLARLPGKGKAVPTLVAGESRLAFRIPPAIDSLALDLESLLDWEAWEPLLAPQAAGRAGLKVPGDAETSIELPFRLMVSPDAHGRWEHARLPRAGPRGDVPLWHTRLRAETIRAIFTPDLGRASALLRSSLSKENRSAIVQLSADAKLLDLDRFRNELTVDEIIRLGQLSANALARPIPLEALMLTALGGDLRAASRFDFPALGGGLLQKMKGHERQPGERLFALDEWTHIAAGGRDHYVRVVESGFLFPFGHRASRVLIAERTFTSGRLGNIDELPGYLTRREFLVVQEPERTYSDRALPFRRVRIASTVTPAIAADQFAFPVVASDHADAESSFDATMIFVAADALDQLGTIAQRYERLADIVMDGQRIAFAAAPATVDAALETESLRLAAALDATALPPFRPLLGEAHVRLPAAEQLGAVAREAARIAYHPAYLGGAALEGIYAEIASGLGVALPAQSAGGLAAPAITLGGLSSVHGAVSSVAAFASGQFESALEGLDGSLLGAVRIKDLLARITDRADLTSFPGLKVDPVRREASFAWVPKLASSPPAPLEWLIDVPPVLTISGVMRHAGASSEVDGSLSGFALVFFKAIRLEFESLRFHMASGAKPEFVPTIRRFDFIGPLSFVGELARRLPLDRFAGSPAISVDRDGVSAGLTIAVPDVALGMLSVQNIALATTLRLYFSETPAELRFALSSRESPFLVSYSLLGGGGFLAITARTSGRLEVEAALELGAVVAFDLAIARGEVQCMVGIYFRWVAGEGVTLGGFVRLYGCVEILRIVTIAVEFYLRLTYEESSGQAVGRAQLTVMVSVLGFSQGVTLAVERRFSTDPRERRSRELLPAAAWREYCEAFA